MVTRGERLTKRADFRRLSRSGRTQAGSLLVLKAMPNLLSSSRYGFSVSRAVGGAVSRNRAKRQLREIARRHSLKPGWDILIIARQSITGARFSEIEKAMVSLMERAHVLGRDDERASAETD